MIGTTPLQLGVYTVRKFKGVDMTKPNADAKLDEIARREALGERLDDILASSEWQDYLVKLEGG